METEGSSEALATTYKNKQCQNDVYYCTSCQSSLMFQDFLTGQ